VDLSLEQLSFNNWFDFPIKLKEKGLILKAFKICRVDWIAFGDPKGEYTKQVKLLPHYRASGAFCFFLYASKLAKLQTKKLLAIAKSFSCFVGWTGFEPATPSTPC
jgi:hypothetical protein